MTRFESKVGKIEHFYPLVSRHFTTDRRQLAQRRCRRGSSRQIAIVAADTEVARRSHPCMTPLAAIGGIRASRSAMLWRRRRPTFSAMSFFGPSRLRST